MNVTVHDPIRGSIKVGEIEDGIFTKLVDSKKHKLKIFPAYGISEDALKIILAHDPQSKIHIIESDTGLDYWSRLSDWVNRGRKMDLGHGEQVFLGLEHMNRE